VGDASQRDTCVGRRLFPFAHTHRRTTCRASRLPTISRNLLADMAGTTRSKVDVLMNKFRKLGFIARVDGGVQVHGSLLTIVTQE
jgi:CRP-like cAMP-binding protein